MKKEKKTKTHRQKREINKNNNKTNVIGHSECFSMSVEMVSYFEQKEFQKAQPTATATARVCKSSIGCVWRKNTRKRLTCYSPEYAKNVNLTENCLVNESSKLSTTTTTT